MTSAPAAEGHARARGGPRGSLNDSRTGSAHLHTPPAPCARALARAPSVEHSPAEIRRRTLIRAHPPARPRPPARARVAPHHTCVCRLDRRCSRRCFAHSLRSSCCTRSHAASTARSSRLSIFGPALCPSQGAAGATIAQLPRDGDRHASPRRSSRWPQRVAPPAAR